MSISSDVRFTARTQAENEIRIKIWNRIGKRTDDVVIKYVNNNISYNLFDKVIDQVSIQIKNQYNEYFK